MVVDDTSITPKNQSADLPPPQSREGGKSIDATSAPSLHIGLARIAFQGQSILENIDFTLAGGETTCLLGPSGVGKTSLLKSIAGFLPIQEDGHISASDNKPLRGRVAYMGQQDLLLPWASVLDNVVISNRLNGQRPDVSRAGEILKAVGLEDHGHVLPDQLSGGMRQRVALARTLMNDHPIVLVDEPFSALDAITRHRLQALLVKLLKGRTVLMITHDPMEAIRVSHHIFVLAGNPVLLSPVLHMDGEPPRLPTTEEQRERLNLILSMLGLTQEDQI
ncbi:ABC transporter ATP-binding protein [Sneathiella aquimaris]|uniref:ABC transporter ATP-binding protein n=1 Tax=Sneathiella aquimaris TaxID=2599305 RepID=UPI00146ACEE2|nr:ABC transporter ATP-binding protein [Sneathiella aquimaris]